MNCAQYYCSWLTLQKTSKNEKNEDENMNAEIKYLHNERAWGEKNQPLSFAHPNHVFDGFNYVSRSNYELTRSNKRENLDEKPAEFNSPRNILSTNVACASMTSIERDCTIFLVGFEKNAERRTTTKTCEES
mgnify:FL=1